MKSSPRKRDVKADCKLTKKIKSQKKVESEDQKVYNTRSKKIAVQSILPSSPMLTRSFPTPRKHENLEVNSNDISVNDSIHFSISSDEN